MPKAKINFHRIIQDTQNYACFQNDEDHMVSRIFFTLEVNGSKYKDLMVEIRQPYGTNFETEPIEVSKPIGYNGPWNHNAFSDLCDVYFRKAVGSEAVGIRIKGQNIRMRNNVFNMHDCCEFEIPDNGISYD